MPKALIPTFLLYAYVAGLTPGPANLASFAAALRYGKKTALRQWYGLFAGYTTVSLSSAVMMWFLGTAFQQYIRFFAWIGAAYILSLSWHILRSSDLTAETDSGVPTFRTGFFLQLTNIKVTMTCLTILSCYVLPYNCSFGALLLMGLFLPFTGPVMNLLWLIAGANLQTFYAKYRRSIDLVMAASLVLCAISLVWPH